MYEDDSFEDIVKDVSKNWFLHTKAYETLRALNRATWYVHEAIEIMDDPEEDFDEVLVNALEILRECAEEFTTLMDEEYDTYEDDDDEDEEDDENDNY